MLHRRHRTAITAVWMLCVIVLVPVLFRDWRYDDPYITYRYADNLSQGRGLVFNHGERILSTTTPFFALVLTLARAAGQDDLHHAALVLGGASLAAGALAGLLLGMKWGRPLLGWTTFFIYPFFGLILPTLSSELPFFLALCLGALAAYEHGRYAVAGGLLALGCITRGDGALLGIVLAIDYLIRLRQPLPVRNFAIAFRPLSIIGFVAGAWVIWAGWYFGSPLPVTLAAKRAQGLMQISQPFAAGVVTVLPAYLHGAVWIAEAVLAMVGIAWSVARVRRAWIVLSWVALHVCAYIGLGVSSYFWYYTPIAPALVLLAALGVDACAHGIGRVGNPALVRGFCLLPLMLAAGHVQQAADAAARPDTRYAIYRAAGEWIHVNTPRAARIGMLEVGITGYYADRYVVDFAGLLQPDVARQMRRESTYDDLALYAIATHRPDHLLLIDGALPQTEAWASTNCMPRQRFPGALYDYSGNLTLYACPGRNAARSSR